jgi:hypothetical protein
MSDIEIRRHPPGGDISDFLAAARVVFADDPHWVPPLNLLLKDQLSPKSPFFQHAEVMFFTARRAGELVGRISAQIDREHLRRYEDGIGFFGFFDTVDDVDVAAALLSAANQWLKQRNMKRLRGPMNLSINQEVGLLVEGFSTPPTVMMPHSTPYQGGIYEKLGLQKAKDLFAWRWDTAPGLPPRSLRALAEMKRIGVVFREVNLKTEIEQLIEIQDDAWRDNWGHVSMTPLEAIQLRRDLALIIDPSIALVAEIDGELAAMALAIPNLNEITRDFDGKLSPKNLAKLLWRLKVEHPKSARLALLGIKGTYRKQKKYMPLALALIAEIARRGYQHGYEWSELSWTVEDNGPVHALIKAAGGYMYKRYRVYEKDIV